jgi:hypothetical protein
MKRLLLIPALALAVLVATPAAGAETLHASFKGQFAEAQFSSVDPSGCVVTDVFIFAVDGTVKETGNPEVTSSAAISVFQFDRCTGMPLFDVTAFPTLAKDEFQIDNQLDTATLNATVEVFENISGTSIPIDVHISWTGNGPTFRTKDRFQSSQPGSKLKVRFDGVSRAATASGTVSDGMTNFTPQAAVFANMGSAKQGEMEIIRE